MQETRVWSLGQEDPVETEMPVHSSILIGKTPWTEESGGLQSMGSQKSQTWLSNYTTATDCDGGPGFRVTGQVCDYTSTHFRFYLEQVTLDLGSQSFSSQVSTDSIFAAHNACKDHSNPPPTWPVLSTFIAWLPLLISSSTCSQGSSWSAISLGRSLWPASSDKLKNWLLRLQNPLLCSQESWAHMWMTGGTTQRGLTLCQALP